MKNFHKIGMIIQIQLKDLKWVGVKENILDILMSPIRFGRLGIIH